MTQQRIHKSARANENSGSPRKSAGRKRATLACEECRVRKRRCNGMIPCEGCAQRMTDCKYASDVETQRWHQSMIHILKAKLQELEHSKNLSQGAHRLRPMGNARIDTTEEPLSHSSLISDNVSTAMNMEPTTTSGLPPPQTPPPVYRAPQQFREESPQSHINPECIAVSLPGQRDSQAIPTSGPGCTPSCDSCPSRCIQPSNLERMIMPISLAVSKMDGLESDTSILSNSSSSSTVLHHSPRARCTCDQSLRAMRCSLPLRKYSDALVARYFSRHNRIFPIIHRPTFLVQYERLWDSDFSSHSGPRSCSGLCTQKSKGKMLPTMVNLVLALGSLFSSPSLEENASRAESFYRTAQEINFLEMMDDEVGIEMIQVGLLMGAYLQSTERYSKCWNVTGFTIRMAQNMGLHFTVAEACKRGLLAPESTPLDFEMRTRVWYGCILLDTDIALLFGQLSMIPVRLDFIKPSFEVLRDYSSGHPQNNADEQVSPADLHSVLDYYYQKIKLYDILRQVIQRDSAIMTTVTSLPADIDAKMRDVLSLDTKIMEWQDNLPSYLKYSKVDGQGRASPLVSGRGPEHLEALDMPALSERLYNRFLHVRQLILRPALEILFKQDQDKPTNHKKSIEAKLREATLLDVASQCVRSSVNQIEFLCSGIEAESFSCWWYNISTLYTSGSTLLMGQFCRLDGPDLDRRSLAASWNHCLVCLSRYRGLSSTAQRSCNILREYSKRLFAQSQDEIGRQLVNEGGHISTIPSAPTTDGQPLNNPLEQLIGSDSNVGFSTGITPAHSLLDTNPHKDHLSTFLPDSYLTDTSSWPYLPFLSQLEDLPLSDPNMSFRMP